MKIQQQYCDIIVLLFCGTNGHNSSELLGSDESDLVVLVWQLLDLNQNKTGDIHYIYVNSAACNNEEFPACDKSTFFDHGITEEMLSNAPSFQDAVQQFEQTLRYELNKQKRTCSFTICTDGPCHLRQVLMPTSVRNETELPEFCYSFFDLKKEFMRCFDRSKFDSRMECNDAEPFGFLTNSVSVDEMLDALNVQIEELPIDDTFGVDHVRKMSSVVQVLISEEYGHIFTMPQRIIQRLETKPSGMAELINDDTVVRSRGLPWQVSDHDVARFFKGLNIARGGVALVLNHQGRRNGEALVRFESVEERDLALLRHKHHMGNRYIEVYRATGDDFLKVAAGTSSEAFNFLNKTGEGIIRMRGLPFTATAKDIADFFGDEIPVAHGEDGILFVKYSDGKFTGDAFVLFPSEELTVEALKKHKQTLGKRYVEIFKSTAAEVQQVLSRHTANANPIVPNMPAQIPYSFLAGAGSPTFQSIPPTSLAIPQPQPAPGSIRNCIRLRGMPYSASVEDILGFLGDFAMSIIPNGIHIVLNQQGRPSGDAFIQLTSAERAMQAGNDVSKGGCHKKHMGERYVEVFQCSGDEMNLVLMGGTLNRNGMVPPPGMVMAQERIPAVHHPVPQPIQVQAPAAQAPFIIQTPQGAFLVQSAPPSTLQAAHQPLEILQPHTILPRSNVYPPVIGNPTPYLSYAQYLPTPPLSPISPTPGNGIPAITATSTTMTSHPITPVITARNAGSQRTQVHMQGMPPTATVNDVLSFFKGHTLTSDAVTLMYNDRLRPAGEAIVTFASVEDAYRAVAENNKKPMGNSYVEIGLV